MACVRSRYRAWRRRSYLGLITAASRIAKSEDAIDLKTSPETTPASSDATEPAEHRGVVGILVELAFSIASFAAGARACPPRGEAAPDHRLGCRSGRGTRPADICKRRCRHAGRSALRRSRSGARRISAAVSYSASQLQSSSRPLTSATPRSTRSHRDASWRRVQALASARTVDCDASMRQCGTVQP